MPKVTLSVRAVGAALALWGTACAQDPEAHRPLIEVRLAREQPAPGFTFMEGVAPNGGWYVQERVIVSDGDVQEASASRTPTGLVLDIRLTREAASRLSGVARQHTGSHLAVVIDGRLVETAPIVGSFSGAPHERVQIGVDLPEAAAQQIAAAVAARWPQ